MIASDLAHVVPSWVPVDGERDREIQGILEKSKISGTDFPLKPWHTYYDWNFFVRVDEQYRHLHSASNLIDHGGIIECEWDTAYVPRWAWPQQSNRIWMAGRWIYDCGHPSENGHKTELHPPKAFAATYTEAKTLPGNAGPTPVTVAKFYAGRQGGYWNQPLNDRDYEFDIYLPPRPYLAAVPRTRVISKTGVLPVQPEFSAYPADDSRMLRVRIPLKGVPALNEYGVVIYAGWSDPTGSQARRVKHVRVRLKNIHMEADYDTSGDEWYVYICVNGRWFLYENIGGWDEALDRDVEFYLGPYDGVLISACGFEADLMHDYMGDSSGYSWNEIAAPNLSQSARESIEDDVFWQLSGSFDDENDIIGLLHASHSTIDRSYRTWSSGNDYRLDYEIKEL